MEQLRSLHWPLVLGLGALALVRPLAGIVTHQAGGGELGVTAVVITIVISVVWIAVVGLTRVAHPVLTLVCAGLGYAVLSMLLSAVLSPVLTGQIQGPFTSPFAIVAVLLTNALWGLAAGLLALLVRRVRTGISR